MHTSNKRNSTREKRRQRSRFRGFPAKFPRRRSSTRSGTRAFLKFERAKSRQLNQKVYARRLSRRSSYTRRVSGDGNEKIPFFVARHDPLLFSEIKHRWPSRGKTLLKYVSDFEKMYNWIILWQLIKNINRTIKIRIFNPRIDRKVGNWISFTKLKSNVIKLN